MQKHENQRFDFLFQDAAYQCLKNYLYSYLLRKRAVEKSLSNENPERVLEVGSGISPVAGSMTSIVYSDLSFESMFLLKRTPKKGLYVVADGMNLPFKADAFSHTICAEVLEHVENDCFMLNELIRILKKPNGRLILTLPHRKAYFANDDRFVNHYRRYEIGEIKRYLRSLGLRPVKIKKVMGPTGKAAMSLLAWIYLRYQRPNASSGKALSNPKFYANFIPLFKWLNRCFYYFMWLEAKIVPLPLATVVLIQSRITSKGDIEGHRNLKKS
jgi:ubiquinone/menaquinone biosynthesis C-methylase UbiE